LKNRYKESPETNSGLSVPKKMKDSVMIQAEVKK